MIELPPLGDLDLVLWHALLDVADRMPEGWTLIGGQMVLLHALERGRTPPRVSQDIDLVVDARVRPPALARMMATLGELGFSETALSLDEIAHRFQRGSAVIDILAPDGLGHRADLRTIGTARTVEVGGGTFALGRSRAVPVSAGGRRGEVHRPDLAGALLMKAVAVRGDTRRGPERHLRDLAFLLTLVEDPFATREALGPTNCGRIRRVGQVAEPGHECWALIEDDRLVSDGQAALAIITAGAAA